MGYFLTPPVQSRTYFVEETKVGVHHLVPKYFHNFAPERGVPEKYLSPLDASGGWDLFGRLSGGPQLF